MSSAMPKKRIVVGALSALSYNDRRIRCRETWFKALAQWPEIVAVFLVGCPDLLSPVLADDLLLLPCPDDYESLSQKTLHFVHWAIKNVDFDYLFKCDDDTYVHPRRLARFPFNGKDYIGADMGGGFASGGAGYFLSRRAAEIVAQRGLCSKGPEDVLVGKTLRASGIRLTVEARFESNLGPHNPPSSMNLLVTTHPVRDGRMHEIHAALNAATEEIDSYEIIQAKVGWGTLGLNGARGFTVENEFDDELDRSDVIASWDEYVTLSAHAPSEMLLRVHEPIAVFGFADGATFDRPKDKILFTIDGQSLFTWGRRSERSREVRLDPGEHALRTSVRRNTRAYSVWAIRKIQSDSIRIVMPTSNDYVKVAATSLQLLERYWPDHPPVDVVHYDQKVPTDLPAHQIYVGRQSEVTWIEGMSRYLEKDTHHELIIMFLDDSGLCAPVDREKIARAEDLMLRDPSLASFYLTWMMLPSAIQYRNESDVLLYPPWTYSCHLQVGIWRRLSLLRALRYSGHGSAAHFEVAGSDYFNRHESVFEAHAGYNLPNPLHPSLLVDTTEKTYWPVPYHNLMQAGQPNERHKDFLQA